MWKLQKKFKIKRIPVITDGWVPEAEQADVMRQGERGANVAYGHTSRSASRVQWVRQEGDAELVRIPEERTWVFQKGGPFQAAGQSYRSLEELRAGRRDHPSYAWYRDCHGRKVLYVEERFPCFDSFDFDTENRYYRWFFLCEGGRLTRVYTEDEKPEIYVTEDVGNLETRCWNRMEELDYLSRR